MSVEFAYSFEKALAAILHLASLGLPEFTKGKVCKLLYLADKRHLVKHGRTVTGDGYFALEHGPVPTDTLRLLDAVEAQKLSSDQIVRLNESIGLDRNFQYPRIYPKASPDLGFLSESDLEVLNGIVQQFGGMTFSQLRGLTHETPAYSRAWSTRRSGDRAPMSFEEFFEEDGDAMAGVQQEMIENDAIRKAFPDPQWL